MKMWFGNISWRERNKISKFSKGILLLIKFNNVTFLDLILNYYSKFDFHEIILLAGYKSEYLKKIS